MIVLAALLGLMLRGGATSSPCSVCGDMSCVEIGWVGRCHWLELCAGFMSLIEAFRSIVKRTEKYAL
jgi:hypothetical protein